MEITVVYFGFRDLGCRVQGLACRVWVWDLLVRAQDLGVRGS